MLRRTRTLPLQFLAAIVVASQAIGCAGHLRPPSLRDGQELYVSACAPCHGVDGSGDGPVAAALKQPPRDLTRLSERNGGVFPRQFFIDTATGEHNFAAHGTREMPVWSQRFGTGGSGAPGVAGVYARQRLEMLADYVASIQRPATP